MYQNTYLNSARGGDAIREIATVVVALQAPKRENELGRLDLLLNLGVTDGSNIDL